MCLCYNTCMIDFLFNHQFPGGTLLQIERGDITREKVDAIVNAANSHLQHGGGVAGAISLAGGPQIQADSDAWIKEHGPVSHAEPAFTPAGLLPCRYVIHAVGPVWGEGDEDAKLASAITGSLGRAESLGIRSIAFPAISTGIFGFPVKRAARIFASAIGNFVMENPKTRLNLIRLVLFDAFTLQTFLEVFSTYPFPSIDKTGASA